MKTYPKKWERHKRVNRFLKREKKEYERNTLKHISNENIHEEVKISDSKLGQKIKESPGIPNL